ncbi:hypothetical protein AMS68_006068 [Peltaster fructicola]|uniref:Uncharacterized protein n=1 Tax=Peltaster fructicola TaxID=286661 RepID=A0A6H0Y0V3_9PEZI|nr:hypothetical protein AMS68_006068 [Peltaster fructicola]
MSRNPFRKARNDDEVISPSNEFAAAGIFDLKSPTQEVQPKAKSTKKKKVVIKTPPRSPEEPTRRLSLGRPPSPIPQQDVESVDHNEEVQDAGDLLLDEALADARRNSGSNIYSPSSTPGEGQIPFNPFARTLATSEDKYAVQGQPDREEVGTRTRPAFDIDTFKNILLNGAAPPVVIRKHVAESEPANVSPSAMDAIASLSAVSPPDATPSYTSSSASDFGSRFPALDMEQPQRASGGEEEAYSSTATQSSPGARAPLDDYGNLAQSSYARPASRSAAGDGIRPDTLSPKAVVPPPPPATRRQAQNSSSSSRRRSSSVMSKSSVQSDSSSISQQPTDANNKAPPPPPSRRVGANRPATSESPLASPWSKSTA